MGWQEILRSNFTQFSELADFLNLSDTQRSQFIERPKFILNLPLRLAAKMEKGTLDDPLLKQFLPSRLELENREGFTEDPVGDLKVQCSPKLLMKYQQRALLLSTSACAMHCRYCFRQNYPYETTDKQFELEILNIEQDKSIQELILSGGDPLSLPNRVLKELFIRLDKISHLRKVRFHTRFPIGIPERIDAEFLELLQDHPWQIWFVIHCNHARELDQEILDRLRQIQKLGIPILNQSVLLKGVNDSEPVLKELFETLSNHGILPYYLHQLDRVRGAAHFEVSKVRGLQLMHYLQKELPGYAVPKYVQEIAGASGKLPIFPTSDQVC